MSKCVWSLVDLMRGVGDLFAGVKYDRPPIALVVEVEGVHNTTGWQLYVLSMVLIVEEYPLLPLLNCLFEGGSWKGIGLVRTSRPEVDEFGGSSLVMQ